MPQQQIMSISYQRLLKVFANNFRLYTYGTMTVRDVQHAIFNLGYSSDDLLRNCPKAPEGNEVDPSVRRMKAVLTHPIGDYAVQPRDATFAAHGVTAAHYMNGGKSLRYATYLVAAALSDIHILIFPSIFPGAYTGKFSALFLSLYSALA